MYQGPCLSCSFSRSRALSRYVSCDSTVVTFDRCLLVSIYVHGSCGAGSWLSRDIVRWRRMKDWIIDSGWQIDCGGWSVRDQRGGWTRELSVSLSSLDVLLDCLVHPFLSVELNCFFLPLEERGERGVKEADALMSLLIRYAHIPFYFRFSFTFPTSPIHPYAPPLRCDRTRARTTIALALSDRSCLFDGHMTYNSHIFTSILSVSNVPPPAV